MKKTDRVFICAVAIIASAMIALTLMQTREAAEQQAAARPTVGGAAGQPRDVNMGKLQRMMETGRLSDHEALYYKPADGETITPPAPP